MLRIMSRRDLTIIADELEEDTTNPEVPDAKGAPDGTCPDIVVIWQVPVGLHQGFH
jgi:hypothetical protein